MFAVREKGWMNLRRFMTGGGWSGGLSVTGSMEVNEEGLASSRGSSQRTSRSRVAPDADAALPFFFRFFLFDEISFSILPISSKHTHDAQSLSSPPLVVSL